jgi:23S rRNA pseudouridine2605 synthase
VTQAKSLRKIGLARALSKLGYCSRSQAAELIAAGRVRLNGKGRRDPETSVHLGKDRIEVDGGAVSARERVYLMLNKPRGLVTTACDEKGRKTVYECLGEARSWIAPVGRLDKASEGLLLFTNDPEWASRLLAPATHLDKTYHVQVGTLVGDSAVEALTKGVRPIAADVLRAKSAKILRQGGPNTWLEVVLDEGKNRQIRHMLEHLGLEVLRLVRVAIGSLVLGELAKGAYRLLSSEELLALNREMRPLGTVRETGSQSGFRGKPQRIAKR